MHHFPQSFFEIDDCFIGSDVIPIPKICPNLSSVVLRAKNTAPSLWKPFE